MEQLVISRHHGERPTAATDNWLQGLPKATLAKLMEIDLIDSRYTTALTPLSKHMGDFQQWLVETPIPGRGRKRTSHYVLRLMRDLRRVTDAPECRFKLWTDIDREKVEKFLGRASETASQRSQNDFIQAIKYFCAWMVDTKRATESPVKSLKLIKVTQRIKRRGLEYDEARRLIETTAKRPPRWGLTGMERAVVYLVAIETGYRIRELQSLRIGNFDSNEDRPFAWRTPAIRLSGPFTKNRVDAEQALSRRRADQLKAYFAGRQPNEPAFRIPDNTKCTRMLRGDLKVAEIPIVDAAGRILTFHGLRHTLGNLLDQTSVSLKTRMDIMRHSTKSNLTLGVYTDDTPLTQKRDAIEKLPELPWPGDIQQQQTEEKIA